MNFLTARERVMSCVHASWSMSHSAHLDFSGDEHPSRQAVKIILIYSDSFLFLDIMLLYNKSFVVGVPLTKPL
ncbi:hypothetical protein KJ628_02280 [Patescibacteria group bacterium]|nr:hypothetical protein [Patescibacteria group bacterium]